MTLIRHFLRRSQTSLENSTSTHSHPHVSDADRSVVTLPTDKPILRPQDDTLQRNESARCFARQILNIDVTEGLTVGVIGPWGSGKTSFINLARNFWKQEGVQVLTFNPWMFSGTEQLVKYFFAELSTQMRLKSSLGKAGKVLDDLGTGLSGFGWVPLIGTWTERIHTVISFIGKILKRKEYSIEILRMRVKKALRELDKPIVVILDDIDRLENQEIRNIFQLVKLTANFPNVIYVLIFDRHPVQNALESYGISGHDYLDKIIQYRYNIVECSPELLNQTLDITIGDVLSALYIEDKDLNLRSTILREIVRPLIRNMRDIKRFVVAAYGAINELNGKVAVDDILALEAIRIFLPDVFEELHKSIDLLTDTYDWEDGGIRASHIFDDANARKGRIDRLLEASNDRQEVIRALIRYVFPDAQEYLDGDNAGIGHEDNCLTTNRVSHKSILRIYLERFVSEDLELVRYAKVASHFLTDAHALDSYLRSLDRRQLVKVIAYLGTFHEEFTHESAVPGCVVLLNLLPDLPNRSVGMFDTPAWVRVVRVMYRLLSVFDCDDEVVSAVQKIIRRVGSLSLQQLLINVVRPQDHGVGGLVHKSKVEKLDTQWRRRVVLASTDELTKEFGLLDILIATIEGIKEGDPRPNITGTPALTLAILKSAQNQIVRPSEDDHNTLRTSVTLDLDRLLRLYADPAVMRAEIDALKLANLEGSSELVRLADGYLKQSVYSDTDHHA